MKTDDELAPQIEWWQNCARFFKEFHIAAEEIKQEYWESQEISSAVLAMSDLREFFHRFPKLEKSYTSIKANIPASASSYRLILSESMLNLFLSASLREVEFDIIAKLAPEGIDKVVFKMAANQAKPEVPGPTLSELRQACKELDKKYDQNLINNHTREEIYQELPWTEAQKWADEKPYVELVQKTLEGFFNATLSEFARKDLIDKYKAEHRKKRYPQGGYEYYDREVKGADGSEIPILDILTDEHESLQTQHKEELPSEDDPHDNLVEEIRAVHGDDVAETAKVYFEIYFQQDKPGKKVKQRQVAQALGKNRKTISRHCIEKIEHFLREKMKKN